MKINKLMISGGVAIALCLSSVYVLGGAVSCGRNLPNGIYVECSGEGATIPANGCIRFSWSEAYELGQNPFTCNFYTGPNLNILFATATITLAPGQNPQTGKVSIQRLSVSGPAIVVNPYNQMSSTVTTTVLPITKVKH